MGLEPAIKGSIKLYLMPLIIEVFRKMSVIIFGCKSQTMNYQSFSLAPVLNLAVASVQLNYCSFQL